MMGGHGSTTFLMGNTLMQFLRPVHEYIIHCKRLKSKCSLIVYRQTNLVSFPDLTTMLCLLGKGLGARLRPNHNCNAEGKDQG